LTDESVDKVMVKKRLVFDTLEWISLAGETETDRWETDERVMQAEWQGDFWIITKGCAPLATVLWPSRASSNSGKFTNCSVHLHRALASNSVRIWNKRRDRLPDKSYRSLCCCDQQSSHVNSKIPSYPPSAVLCVHACVRALKETSSTYSRDLTGNIGATELQYNCHCTVLTAKLQPFLSVRNWCYSNGMASTEAHLETWRRKHWKGKWSEIQLEFSQ
jgi:hypothetical protein